jgi:hypothetical protein
VADFEQLDRSSEQSADCRSHTHHLEFHVLEQSDTLGQAI